MKRILVDVAEYEMAQGAQSELVAKCVGSGIVVTFYDATTKTGGLLHTLFPNSRINPDKARLYPEAFSDSGVLRALRAFQQKEIDPTGIEVKIAGGAAIHNPGGRLQIGKRNFTTVKSILDKLGIVIGASSIGGVKVRDVRLSLDTGELHITTDRKEEVL